jgi:hypothetical protein
VGEDGDLWSWAAYDLETESEASFPESLGYRMLIPEEEEELRVCALWYQSRPWYENIPLRISEKNPPKPTWQIEQVMKGNVFFITYLEVRSSLCSPPAADYAHLSFQVLAVEANAGPHHSLVFATDYTLRPGNHTQPTSFPPPFNNNRLRPYVVEIRAYDDDREFVRSNELVPGDGQVWCFKDMRLDKRYSSLKTGQGELAIGPCRNPKVHTDFQR